MRSPEPFARDAPRAALHRSGRPDHGCRRRATLLFGWAAAAALGEVLNPPPLDPTEFNKQAANVTDVVLLGLLGLTTGVALASSIRFWIRRQWRILLVPLGVAPVLAVLFIALAFNNWQY